VSLRPLFLHQERAIAETRASLASGHKRPMVQGPCGFGKTLTAAHIIQRALDKGKRVAFVVPRKSLIDQAVSDFAREGIRVPSRFMLELTGASSGDMRLSDHAARSMI
jgi:DNA repair protein RadD